MTLLIAVSGLIFAGWLLDVIQVRWGNREGDSRSKKKKKKKSRKNILVLTNVLSSLFLFFCWGTVALASVRRHLRAHNPYTHPSEPEG